MACNTSKVEEILEGLRTGDLKDAPHDVGMELRENIPLAPEWKREQYVDALLRMYSTETRPIKWNIMYALEEAIPSFRDQGLQVRLYTRVIDLVVAEDKTKSNEHNWPRDFGTRVVRRANELDPGFRQALFDYIDDRIAQTERYPYHKGAEVREQLVKVRQELE